MHNQVLTAGLILYLSKNSNEFFHADKLREILSSFPALFAANGTVNIRNDH